jgi:hypothetical protein
MVTEPVRIVYRCVSGNNDVAGRDRAVICNYFFQSTGFDGEGVRFFKDVTAVARQIFSKGQEVLPRVELSLVIIHNSGSCFKRQWNPVSVGDRQSQLLRSTTFALNFVRLLIRLGINVKRQATEITVYLSELTLRRGLHFRYIWSFFSPFFTLCDLRREISPYLTL